MLANEPKLRSSSPTTLADPSEYGDRSVSVWGQLLLLLILSLVALMRCLR